MLSSVARAVPGVSDLVDVGSGTRSVATPTCRRTPVWVLEEGGPALGPVFGGDERLLKFGLQLELVGKGLP